MSLKKALALSSPLPVGLFNSSSSSQLAQKLIHGEAFINEPLPPGGVDVLGPPLSLTPCTELSDQLVTCFLQHRERAGQAVRHVSEMARGCSLSVDNLPIFVLSCSLVLLVHEHRALPTVTAKTVEDSSLFDLRLALRIYIMALLVGRIPFKYLFLFYLHHIQHRASKGFQFPAQDDRRRGILGPRHTGSTVFITGIFISGGPF